VLVELRGKQAILENKAKLEPSYSPNMTFKEPILEQNTPIVLMSTDDDVIRFIRKETTSKCNRKVYNTNYDNIYVSKEIINNAIKSIKPVDLRQYYYMNNKIDYVSSRL